MRESNECLARKYVTSYGVQNAYTYVYFKRGGGGVGLKKLHIAHKATLAAGID